MNVFGEQPNISPFMRETTWMETSVYIPLPYDKPMIDGSPFMRETTWMETWDTPQLIVDSTITLPLWGKLLEWKHLFNQTKVGANNSSLSLYEGNYLNGN